MFNQLSNRFPRLSKSRIILVIQVRQIAYFFCIMYQLNNFIKLSKTFQLQDYLDQVDYLGYLDYLDYPDGPGDLNYPKVPKELVNDFPNYSRSKIIQIV